METFGHTAHSVAGMTCADCHLSPHSDSEGTAVAEVTLVGGGAAPDHSFKTAGGSCAGCHGSNVHQQVVNEEAVQIGATQLVQMTDRTRDLALELDDAKRENRSLQAMTVVSLGFGLGSGGVLGIVFVSLVCFLSRGESEK
jgi:formate-dependent nitrite reductase cytochrome c552 subunit